MDVRLSPEQVALRESVAQAVDRLGPKTVRDLDDDERVAKLNSVVDASGWRELRSAEAPGAPPVAGGVEVALIAEEMGFGLADTAFLGPTLAADLRRRAGAGLASSEETVLFSADLSVLGDPADSGVAVDARSAACALAGIRAPDGSRIVAVPILAPSDGADLTRPSSRPAILATQNPAGGALGLVAHDALDAWAALGLALASADLVGVIRGAVQLGCGYAATRRQFGVPVGSFQAVQHLLADAHVAAEGSRSVALHAAWAVDALPPKDALAAAALAKAYCARAAQSVCEAVIQVHGGIGNTWDCLAHLYLRRALLSADVLGGVGPSLDRVLASRGIRRGHDGLR